MLHTRRARARVSVCPHGVSVGGITGRGGGGGDERAEKKKVIR